MNPRFRKENLREIQSQFYFRLPPKIISNYQILLPRNIDSHHRLGDWLAPSSLALTPSLALPQWPLCICTLRSPDTTPLPSQTKTKEPHSSTTMIFAILRQLRKAKSALASIWGHGLTSCPPSLCHRVNSRSKKAVTPQAKRRKAKT